MPRSHKTGAELKGTLRQSSTQNRNWITDPKAETKKKVKIPFKIELWQYALRIIT